MSAELLTFALTLVVSACAALAWAWWVLPRPPIAQPQDPAWSYQCIKCQCMVRVQGSESGWTDKEFAAVRNAVCVDCCTIDRIEFKTIGRHR